MHYVGFAVVLERSYHFLQDYRIYWANEMHPTAAGFKVLAGAVAAQLLGLGIPSADGVDAARLRPESQTQA